MRVSIRHSGLLLIFTLLFVFSLKAEPLNEKFLQTQWTTENGLPQNSVTSIAQTPDGYLWLGTFGGLARFDGLRFKIYTTSNTPELKTNRITALTLDKKGTLWIATERGEIIVLKDGKFKLVDDGREINNFAIGELYADENDLIWAANGYLLRVCAENKCQNQNEEIYKGVQQVRRDPAGNLWLMAGYRLYRFVNGRSVSDEIFTNEILAIETNPKGGLWVLTKSELALYKDGRTKTVLKINNANESTALTSLPDGSLWFYFGEDLYDVKDRDVRQYKIANVGLNNSHQVFVDREGNVWLGLIGEGLIRLLERRVQTLTFGIEHKGGLLQNIAVNSLAEDRDGSVWIATDPVLFRWREGKTERVLSEPNLTRGTLLVDSGGTLWNTTGQGLQSRQNGKSDLWQEISWRARQTGNSLFEDSRKNLWYGCTGCGVITSDREKIIARYSIENGLAGNIVCFITETRDGAMWFGTTSGLSRLQNASFTNFTTENGLSNDYVRDIYEDREGTLWIGTYGGGLNRFRDGKFTPITTQDGLFDDIVSRILVDDDDNFWMLGNRGIYSVNRQMLNDFADGKIEKIYCNAYTTADGMITSEGNGGYQNAGIRARDGRLWFPMINGVVIIDPKQEKLTPPKPLIEEVFLKGKEVDPSQKVEINPGNESLEINYTGLSFRKPEQMRFRYRLAGLDENWTEAGTRRLANYPYLPSGNFRFQLQAANADGIWSEKIAELEIVVFPPFWKTWWFSALILLIGALILYAAYKYRNWNFAREKAVREEFARRLLNAQENERRRIASEIHDNLGQQLLIIKNWAAYCLGKISKSSPVRLQITQISETADEALNEVRAMAKNLSPYHLDKAGLTNTIDFMVKQVAESSEINFYTEIDDVDGVLPKEDEINLYRIVQEGVNNIIKHSHARRAKVILERDENFLRLVISDDGEGFQKDESDYSELGMGLNGITERAKMLGGNLTIKSVPKNGTQIVLEIGV